MSKVTGSAVRSSSALCAAARQVVQPELRPGQVARPVRDVFEAGTARATSAPRASGAAATGGAPAAGTTSSSQATPSMDGGVDALFDKLGGEESALMSQFNQVLGQTPDPDGNILIDGKPVNASVYMQKLQFHMNILQEMMETLSNMLKAQHDTRMNTIANIRG